MITKLSKYTDRYKNHTDPLIRKECEDISGIIYNDLSCANDNFAFEPGQSVYMLGCAGNAGTDIIIKYHPDLCRNTHKHVCSDPFFSNSFFKGSYIIKPRERGVYQSLFLLHQLNGLGFEVDVKLIPVSPCTIDISDHLSLNPFKLLTDHCYIFVVPVSGFEREEEQIRYAKLKGVSDLPVKIGVLTEDKDMKLISSDGTISLLNRPGRDELLKILDDK